MKKNIFPLLMLAIVGIGLMVSCTKPSPTPQASSIKTPSIAATIGSISWKADSISGQNNNNGATSYIVGINYSDSITISFTVPNYTSGTYSLDGQSYALYYRKNGRAYNSTSGTIVTQSNNHVITGTFSCIVTNVYNSHDVISITNGTFSYRF